MMYVHLSGSAEPIEGGRLLVAGLRDSCVLVPCLFVFAVTPVLIMPWCGSRNLVKMSLQWWLAAWWLDTDV